LLRHAARQHEVHLIALNQPRLLPRADLPASVAALSRLCASVEVFDLFAERSAAHRAMNMALSVASSEPFDVAWLHSRAFHEAVERWRTDRDLALVHADTIGLWPYADRLRERVPIVLGHHNVESDFLARRAAQEPSRVKAALLKRDARKLATLERTAAPTAAINLVVSALDGDRLAAVAPGAAVEVVENGVDLEYWTPSVETPRERSLIFAGTLGWYPNRDAVEYLLSAIWPALLASNPDRRLTLVGRDAGPMAVAAAAADPRVAVTGFVPDVRPYMRAASVYVCPIRVGGGTRLKVLDALAMGRPLVATGISVEGLDLVEGVHYLRAETPAEFVAQIERLELAPDVRAALGAAGRRFVVERFGWSVIGRQLDRAYQRALSRS
jgi:glycosyltransferase involved in cell wall biosynthesis